MYSLKSKKIIKFTIQPKLCTCWNHRKIAKYRSLTYPTSHFRFSSSHLCIFSFATHSPFFTLMRNLKDTADNKTYHVPCRWFRHYRHAYRTYINSTLFCFLVSCISGFRNFWYLSMAITLNLFTLQCTLPPRDKTRCDVISHYQGFRQEQDHPQKCRSFLCLPYYQVYTVA